MLTIREIKQLRQAVKDGSYVYIRTNEKYGIRIIESKKDACRALCSGTWFKYTDINSFYTD
jgi:hypothetical protein